MDFFDKSRNARSGAARARAVRRAQAADRARAEERPVLRAAPGRRRSRKRHRPRGARAAPRHAQVRPDRAAEIRAAVRGHGRAGAGRPRAHIRFAGAGVRSGGAPRRLLAHRPRDARRGLPPRRDRAQRLCVSLHAGRLDVRPGRAGAGVRGDSGGHRADRNAGAGDRRRAPAVLRRHAVLPAHHPGEGGRDGRRRVIAREGAGLRGGAAGEPARVARGSAGSPRSNATPARTWG